LPFGPERARHSPSWPSIRSGRTRTGSTARQRRQKPHAASDVTPSRDVRRSG